MTNPAIRARRTLLYMPGARIEILPKALASGADIVCVDLEDAVAADVKDETRSNTLSALANTYADDGVERLIRINGVETEAGAEDLAALSDTPYIPDGIVIPKCSDPDHVRQVTEAIPGPTQVHPLIESSRGLEAAYEIAQADTRVGFIMLGSQDMALDLRAEHSWQPLLYARSRLAAAAAAADVDILDAPWFDIPNTEGLEAEAQAVKALGYSGKSLIHPKHVTVVNEVFSPTASEVAEARDLIKKFEAQDNAAVMIDGQFLEPPIIERLKRIAALGDRIGL